MKIPTPLLLDGATATNLIAAGLPADSCPEEWMLQNNAPLVQLQEAFLQAGSQLLYTPTYSANRLRLAEYGLEDQFYDYNKRLSSLTKALAGERLVAGCISPPFGLDPEEMGESFLKLISAYAEQAFALRDGGVDLFVADTMTSLAQCRAALLGCRQAGKPVMITMTVDEEGETSMGCDLLSALIVCQSMGAVAFGLTCNSPKSMLPHIQELRQYARIPLIAKPNAGFSGQAHLSPHEMAGQMEELLLLGVPIIGGCCHTTAQHIGAMRQLLDRFDFSRVPPPHPDTDGIFLATDTQPYFLQETFELSEPISCGIDMADALLEVEESGADVASILIESVDDAFQFAQNAHMLQIPASFLCDNEEALEMALLLYQGRALVDSQSLLPPDVLDRIALGVSAVVR